MLSTFILCVAHTFTVNTKKGPCSVHQMGPVLHDGLPFTHKAGLEEVNK